MNEYLIIAADKATLRKGIKKMLYAEKPIMVAITSGMDAAARTAALKAAVDADIADSETTYTMYPLDQIVTKDAETKANADGSLTITKAAVKMAGAQLILHMKEPLTKTEMDAGTAAGLTITDRANAPNADKWMGFQ